jgi:L-iditol 2-dehydrogenase
MKAAILESPRNMTVRRIRRPACPADGILVKVSCCAICSSDARMVVKGHLGLVYPRIPGHEFAGVVFESRSANFDAGDRVQIYPGLSCGRCSACRRGDPRRCVSLKTLGFSEDGGFTEYLPITETLIALGGVNLVPENVTDNQAALVEPLASCLNAQEKTRVGCGDTVLIVGGGPLGLLHSRLARHRGASKIIVTETNEIRLTLARELGQADRVVDVSLERLPQVISDETGGKGATVVLLASSSSPVANLLPLLADGGRLSLFSGMTKDCASMTFDVNQIHYRELEVSGSFGSAAAQNTSALKLIAGGLSVEDLITKRLGIDEIMEGIEYTSACKGLRAMVCFNQ